MQALSLEWLERRTPRPGPYLALVVAGAAAISFALVYGQFPFSLAAVGFVAMLLVLPLAIIRYEAVVIAGVLLLGAVRFEPAPCDAVFMMAILAAVASGRWHLNRLPFAPTVFLLAFFAVNLLSSVFVIDPHRAARFLGITLYLGIFSLWFTGYLSSAGRVRAVVRAYVFAAVTSAVLGLAALIVPFPQHELFLEFGDRARGLFKDANVFGPFLVPAAIFVLDDLWTPRFFGRSRVKKVAVFALLCVATVFSFSRAAWINLAAALIVYTVVVAIRRNAGRRLLTLLFIALVLAAVTTSALVATGAFRFLQTRATVQTYDTQRFGAQRQGLRLARHHPAGVGPGQFEVAEGQEGSNEIVVGRPISAHSTYVRVLAEQGFLGIVILIALFAGTLAIAGRGVIKGRDLYGLDFAPLLAAWCGLLVNSFVIDSLHWRHLWVIAALIWAGAARATYAPFSRARTVARQ